MIIYCIFAAAASEHKENYPFQSTDNFPEWKLALKRATARQQTKIVQLLKISILLEPQSMLVESHFTNMQRAAI
jgi:hypothetical protein